MHYLSAAPRSYREDMILSLTGIMPPLYLQAMWPKFLWTGEFTYQNISTTGVKIWNITFSLLSVYNAFDIQILQLVGPLSSGWRLIWVQRILLYNNRSYYLIHVLRQCMYKPLHTKNSTSNGHCLSACLSAHSMSSYSCEHFSNHVCLLSF